MSLPFIYKPYVLTRERDGWPPCGTYVDGGVWNNLPFREFNLDHRGAKQPCGTGKGRPDTPASAGADGLQSSTLGLRLTIDPAERVERFTDVFSRLVISGLTGSGESQVLAKYGDRTIQLDTRGLSLVDFNPPPRDRDRAIKRARRATWRYFGCKPPEEDVDAMDDLLTGMLEKKTRACAQDSRVPSLL